MEIGSKNQTPEFSGISRKNGGNRRSDRGFGDLLVQNRSQEVQEYFGQREKARIGQK